MELDMKFASVVILGDIGLSIAGLSFGWPILATIGLCIAYGYLLFMIKYATSR